MYTNINSIVQLFPDYEHKIDRMFQYDENFRDLCSEYMLCASMILERKNQINKHLEEIAEFEELQRLMEEEILREILKENDPVHFHK